ncbi:cupin domain-containing protein [Sphaerochaeta sp. PS]|uniref:cupin domain-containing protein n=1 Tax=Sphaerochaeta sp. PS TaxID=3076336 RepID=UPI0028A45F7A|nr:cupin domain-containing protein [Sphaerochaeta sp. PS]MDT4763036.1 cupin domain-containing protein [Sphaerochaeta sp. PS]
MFVSHRDEIEKKQIVSPTTHEVTKQVLVGPDQGWKDYVMRMFTLGKGGFAPKHTHPWQHILYIVEGKGTLFLDGKDYPLTAGSTAYVPAEALHQILNAGEEPFVFLCIVPEFGDK